MVAFHEEIARTYDDWKRSSTGSYMDGREKSLMLDLVAPRGGERLLDVGCGTGDHLLLFRRKGCDVTGIDPSPFMLDVARRKMENRAELRQGTAEDLPFSDNEFDIVTLITSLEFTRDPQKAISEAIRVCRGRVFLGVLNKFSCIGIHRRIQGFSRANIYSDARFFHIGELAAMVRHELQGVRIRWGSVIYFPWSWYGFAKKFEESIPVMKNPFGAFFGLSFPVTFSYTTIQEPVRERFTLVSKSRQPIQGAAREIE